VQCVTICMVVACGLCNVVVFVFVVAFLVSAGIVYCMLPTGLPRSSGGSSTTTVAPDNKLFAFPVLKDCDVLSV